MSSPLWQPSPERIARTNLTAFLGAIESEWGEGHSGYEALHRWSLEYPEKFWSSVWSQTGVIGDRGSDRVLLHGDRLPGAKWFPDARLNFAENLLRSRDAKPALIFRGEDGARRVVSHTELYADVSRLQQALRAWGVVAGDRVAGYLPNLPETLIAMLAATSLGAIWSSCSPDFGEQGVLDRFGQIEPKVLFCVDGYFYQGKRHDRLEQTARIRSALPSLERLVVVPFHSAGPTSERIPDAVLWPDVLAEHPPGGITFERLPFDHPLYVLYSSGTTGAPKCIVHGAGGTLLQHMKEQQLHVDLKPGQRLFYFTTTGWMMWNWLVSGLASDATLVLYEGSPFHPEPGTLFRLAEEERVEIFGTSAKFIDAVIKERLEPGRDWDLSALETVLSTGSPLAAEAFDWVYEHVKPDLCLASVSGGTDIISCFVLGNPLGAVRRGEIQAPGLGMNAQVYDEEGKPVEQAKGELVCTQPFPSVPIGFWNDPQDERFHAAYFEKFPGVWAHGDFAERTASGGFVIFGRSDAVLNAGGVRIGTAEIYRVVERFDEVIEGLAIGQSWEGDTRIVLFVRLRDGIELDDGLRERLRSRIRSDASPRHVPARIVQVADIPRTKSGKIVELAVRSVVHGDRVTNREALANPEALELFSDLPELKE